MLIIWLNCEEVVNYVDPADDRGVWAGRDRYETEQIILENLLTQESPAYFANALVEGRVKLTGFWP